MRRCSSRARGLLACEWRPTSHDSYAVTRLVMHLQHVQPPESCLRRFRVIIRGRSCCTYPLSPSTVTPAIYTLLSSPIYTRFRQHHRTGSTAPDLVAPIFARQSSLRYQGDYECRCFTGSSRWTSRHPGLAAEAVSTCSTTYFGGLPVLFFCLYVPIPPLLFFGVLEFYMFSESTYLFCPELDLAPSSEDLKTASTQHRGVPPVTERRPLETRRASILARRRKRKTRKQTEFMGCLEACIDPAKRRWESIGRHECFG